MLICKYTWIYILATKNAMGILLLVRFVYIFADTNAYMKIMIHMYIYMNICLYICYEYI
jgi:hypothetical protein